MRLIYFLSMFIVNLTVLSVVGFASGSSSSDLADSTGKPYSTITIPKSIKPDITKEEAAAEKKQAEASKKQAEEIAKNLVGQNPKK